MKFISDQHLQICKTLQLFGNLFAKYYNYLQAYLQNITAIYKLINKILQLFTSFLQNILKSYSKKQSLYLGLIFCSVHLV